MILLILSKYFGGNFDVILYEDIVILCASNRKILKPNIYINTKFLSIGETIRGSIIVACKENDNFKSLTKEQCIKYINFLKRASFNYNHTLSQNYPYTYNKHSINNGRERDLGSSSYDISGNVNNNKVLQMILAIQTIILKFIKNNEN